MPSVDTDPSVTDLSISRRRIWVKNGKKNRFLTPIVVDTGWDLVQYDGFPEGLEPGVNNFEQRADGKVSDRRYTGIMVLDERDTLALNATSTGGPIPRGAF
mgnify:CR=1 FL=1